jgi:N-acetyl sugar amidotransferase
MTAGLCSASVMDDSDPDITFDENGVSNHVLKARERLRTECFRGADGERRLNVLLDQIRAEGVGKPYDCVIGLSGGVDSTFVAIRCRELGLRPLAIHLDNGWNTELAVANVERTLRVLDLDLFTHVIDWEEVKDLQRSYFEAGLPNVEAITDHAITALLYRQAAKLGVRFILSGSNIETESIMPDAWSYDARDALHIASIHRRFGVLKRLKTFPMMYPPEFLAYIFVRRIRHVPILNYGPYNKAAVIGRLQAELGWVPYERKHGESRFTRFFQEYYLPTRFGYDKRKAHFSSLIVAGQMTRDEAFSALNQPLYRPHDRAIEIEYVTKKLGYDADAWAALMARPPGRLSDYANLAWMFDHKRPVTQFVRRVAKGERRAAGPLATAEAR